MDKTPAPASADDDQIKISILPPDPQQSQGRRCPKCKSELRQFDETRHTRSGGASLEPEMVKLVRRVFSDLAEPPSVARSPKDESRRSRRAKKTFPFSRREDGLQIDKETFLLYWTNGGGGDGNMPLPGVLGERIFAVFDRDASGFIDFEEFLRGLEVLTLGSHEQQMKFIFDLYDLDGNGFVSRDELSMMLSHILAALPATIAADVTTECSSGDLWVESMTSQIFRSHQLSFREFLFEVSSNPQLTKFVSVFYEFALTPQRCIPLPPRGWDGSAYSAAGGASEDSASRLTRHWWNRSRPSPVVICGADSIETRSSKPRVSHADVVLCPNCDDQSPLSPLVPVVSISNSSLDVSSTSSDFSSAKSPRSSLAETAVFAGWLAKPGHRFGGLRVRYYVLRNGFLFAYYNDTDAVQTAPSTVMFLAGCTVASLNERLESGLSISSTTTSPITRGGQALVELAKKIWGRADGLSHKSYNYGFEIRPTQESTTKHSESKTRTLYASSPGERDSWMVALSRASGQGVGFHDAYTLHERVGRGKFGSVYRAEHKQTQVEVAVKILSKNLPFQVPKKIGDPFARKAGRFVAGAPAKLGQKTRSLIGRRRSKEVEEDVPGESSSLRWMTSSTRQRKKRYRDREFRRTELAVLRLLRHHPNIVQLVEVFETPTYLYIVMEWVPGDLRRIIEKHMALSGFIFHDGWHTEVEDAREFESPASKFRNPGSSYCGLRETFCRVVIQGILRGLVHCHDRRRNVIHRDIKPENILVSLDNPVSLCRKFSDIKSFLQSYGAEDDDTNVKLVIQNWLDELNVIIQLVEHLIGVDEAPTTSQNVKPSTDIRDAGRKSTKGRTMPPQFCGRVDSTLLFGDLSEAEAFTLSQTKQTPDPGGGRPSARSLTAPPLKSRKANNWSSSSSSNEARKPSTVFIPSPRRAAFPSGLLSPGVAAQLATVSNLFHSLVRANMRVKISDFGFAKVLAPADDQHFPSSRWDARTAAPWNDPDPSSPSKHNISSLDGPVPTPGFAVDPIGTLAYAAPEVLLGQPYTTSADIWSIGVLAYELLSGGSLLPRSLWTGAVGEARTANLEMRSAVEMDGSKMFGMHIEGWSLTTPCAMEFVESLLRVDPKRRPSAAQALDHQWLQD